MAGPRRFSGSVLLARASTKVQALCWVAGGVATAIFGRVFDSMWEPGKSNLAFIQLGWLAAAFFATLMLYAVVWVPVVLRIDVPIETYSPRLGFAAAGAGVVAFVSFTVGLWPSFGWLAPLVVASQAMACMMSMHFVPTCS